MKKVILTFVVTLFVTGLSFARCKTISFGFGSYTWGTYTVLQERYVESGGTFVLEQYPVEMPCNGGDHWDWIWD